MVAKTKGLGADAGIKSLRIHQEGLRYSGLSRLPMLSAESRRADLRTADLSSLRVIGHALQGFAQACKSRIFRGVSFPCLAQCCAVLRSRWYQSGIKRAPVIRVKWCRKAEDDALPVPLRSMGE